MADRRRQYAARPCRHGQASDTHRSPDPNLIATRRRHAGASLNRSRLRRTIPAGLLDAGFAALATFVTGIVAARLLDPATLGTYALFRAAMFGAGTGPTQMVLVPSTVVALSRSGSDRLAYLLPSLRLALGPALLSTIVFLGSALLMAQADGGVLVALSITAFGTSVLSSVQDHVRRMLHLAGASWKAAWVSLLQLAGVTTAVAGLLALDVQPIWIPFGALGLANAASLTLGITLALTTRPRRLDRPLRLRELVRSGRWLLVDGIANPAGSFLSAAAITGLAGPSILGYAEAARVLASPITVAALGLSAVIGPRSMEAASNRHRAEARRYAGIYWGLLGMLGIGYLVAAVPRWSWNPLSEVIPLAYAISGLLAFSIMAELVNGQVRPFRYELIGGRREKRLAIWEGIGNVLRVAGSSTAPLIGSFAFPTGILVHGTTRWIGYGTTLLSHYREKVDGDE